MQTLTIWHGRATPARAVGRHQCRMLDFALRFPGWHTMAPDRTTRRAAAGLARRGCIEIAGDQFRFHRTI